MYSEKVMDHFNHPRNVGEIENASGVGTVGNAKCGDIMRIYLDIDDDRKSHFLLQQLGDADGGKTGAAQGDDVRAHILDFPCAGYAVLPAFVGH